MNDKPDDLDRRITAVLQKHTDEAAGRAPGLWPSIGERQKDRPARRRLYWAAIPACAAVVAAALLLPGWLSPTPDVLSCQPTASPATAGDTMEYAFAYQSVPVGGDIHWPDTTVVTSAQEMQAYCRQVYDQFASGSSGTGGFPDAFSAFITEEQRNLDQQWMARNMIYAQAYDPSVFDNSDLIIIGGIEDSSGVAYEVRGVTRTGDTVTVSIVSLTPQARDDDLVPRLMVVQVPKGAADGAQITAEYADEPAEPAVTGSPDMKQYYAFDYQVIPTGISNDDWPGRTLITSVEQMEDLCRQVYELYGSDGFSTGGFPDAFSAFMTDEQKSMDREWAARTEPLAQPYDPSVFEDSDLIIIKRILDMGSGYSYLVDSVAGLDRMGQVSITAYKSRSADDYMESPLFVIQVPKGVMNNRSILVISGNGSIPKGIMDDIEPTPSPTVAPGTAYNAFGLPADEMVPLIVDEYGMLIPGWQEMVALQCASNNREAPDFSAGHPAWPAREAALARDDLMLWDTPLETGQDEALASIEAAMAGAYGQKPLRTADSTGDDETRTVEWSDGTRAVFAGGVLYSLETTSREAAMLPGLAAGGSIAGFIKAYGLPRVDESGGTLSWPLGSNPLGNDYLFVTARDGTVTGIRISLIQ